MDFFRTAKTVKLRSHHDKYLIADDDEESVSQDRNGSSKQAKWTVEFAEYPTNIVRLKSCFNRYLTATDQHFLLGMTGEKVLQTVPSRVDSSVEWEPVREGAQVKLKTRYGQFLRANGGLPPWRNSITHDIPHRSATQEWILWNVEVVELRVQSPPVVVAVSSLIGSAEFDRQEESIDSPLYSPSKMEGRTIYYQVLNENGDIDEATEGHSLIFKGSGVYELTKNLEEETGLEDIIVCTRSAMNGKLYPLRLHLPPNNANMHVIVVPSSSREKSLV